MLTDCLDKSIINFPLSHTNKHANSVLTIRVIYIEVISTRSLFSAYNSKLISWFEETVVIKICYFLYFTRNSCKKISIWQTYSVVSTRVPYTK